ncbi:MAG: hypothetical protein CMP76_00990 [Flavobacterium sp.]|uniref:PH domain-containing protein n=1 Tax=Flavobacterium sp. TaxID=239 RepID=UPI000C395388|nr:PH domain-containing protein [Flavobacterium sp.]MBF01850.1 hypothetical protein [Flavobacterium sp.]
MLDHLKKILNEDQDPKAIEKITSKLENLIMTNEEVGYIAVQKKPAITIFPDSIVVTNKRIILCKPKNLGLSMEFVDYDWADIEAAFVKEGILGSDFTFSTKTQLTQTIDYLPKNQARKLYTYSKEQLDIYKNKEKNTFVNNIRIFEDNSELLNREEDINVNSLKEKNISDQIEEAVVEEVIDFAEILPVPHEESNFTITNELEKSEKKISELSQEELFEKLQNYKRLLDNGLILQGEYDKLKAEILKHM